MTLGGRYAGEPAEAPVSLALRTLASPPAVLALVVLAMNDHVLKQAWPGLVTGKLSDVAGLVFAPLLLAVPLAALRVPRPTVVAIVLTGVGFALTKGSVEAAAVTSAVWSLSGIPTEMGADRWDLLTLPALAGAWWAARAVARRPVLAWRRVMAVALGTAMLPVGMLATAATSCDPGHRGIEEVSRAEGLFPGQPGGREVRLVLGVSFNLDRAVSVDAKGSVWDSGVGTAWPTGQDTVVCDPTLDLSCWRIVGTGVTIEHSVNGGLHWAAEVDLDDERLEELSEADGGPVCGDEQTVEAVDLGILPTGEGEPIVAVALVRGGAYVRDPDGEWSRWSLEDLLAAPSGDGPGAPALPIATPLDEPSPPPVDQPAPWHEDYEPPCDNPSIHSVTPNPQNGPPTTYDVCPP